MLENIRNFLRKIIGKKRNKQIFYTTISVRKTLIGEEINYEEYAINVIKDEIKRNIDSFVDIIKETNEDGSINIIGKIDIYGK